MNYYKLSKLTKYLIYLVALTPLIITPTTIYPFNFGRGMIIQFIVEIIFGLYAVLALFNQEYRPKKNILTILLAIFLGVSFISSLSGADFYKSFWSTPERFTGWFFLLHIFLFFIILTSVLRTGKEWKKFLGFNVVVSLLMFGIAILSLFGVKFWGVDLGMRISGTLGNPIFLASYFILNLTFAAYLFFSEERKKYKIILFLACAALASGIFLTQSRGAVLGLLAGIVFGMLFYAFCGRHKSAKRTAIIGISVVVFTVFIFGLLRNKNFIQNNSILDRITDFSLTSGTGNTRLMGWKVALHAIAERPILGWGMEGFDVAFNKYYNPQFLRYSYYETWFDKPHNKILEIAVDGGFVGLILYLSVFGYSFHILRKKVKEGGLPLSGAAILAGGLGAYFAQNLFVFDTSTSYLLFFIFLAFISSAFREHSEHTNKKVPLLILAPVFFIFVAASWFLNVSPLLADSHLSKIVIAPSEMGTKINISEFKKEIIRFNPYRDEWITDLAKSMISSLRASKNLYSDTEIIYGIEGLKNNISNRPNSAYYHMLLGEFYAEFGIKDEIYFNLAKSELDESLRLSPQRQHIYFGYGRLYALMKDRNKMIESFNKAISLAPEAALSYWEGAKQLYVLNEKDPLVTEWLKKVVENRYLPEETSDFMFIFQHTFQYFLEDKNYNALAGLYERMGQIEPQEAKWHAQRATVEYMLGNKTAAIDEINKAIELDDSYRVEGEKFIHLIQVNE